MAAGRGGQEAQPQAEGGRAGHHRPPGARPGPRHHPRALRDGEDVHAGPSHRAAAGGPGQQGPGLHPQQQRRGSVHQGDCSKSRFFVELSSVRTICIRPLRRENCGTRNLSGFTIIRGEFPLWRKIFYDDWNNIKYSFTYLVLHKLFLTQFSFNSRWVQTVHESVLKYCLIETDPLTSSRAFRPPTLEVRFLPDQIRLQPNANSLLYPVKRRENQSLRGSYRIRNATQSIASVGHCYQLEIFIPSIFGLTHIFDHFKIQ